MVIRAFITSQFSCRPLVWMCHSRNVDNKINKLQERALRLVYNDRHSTFEELLDKDKYLSIHHPNLQVLAKEMYKVYSNVSPDIMNDIFETWNFVPENIKDAEDIISFKAKIKPWKPESCPCRLRKVYLPQISFF